MRVFIRHGCDMEHEETLRHYASVLGGKTPPMFHVARVMRLEDLIHRPLSHSDLAEADIEHLIEWNKACVSAMERQLNDKWADIPPQKDGSAGGIWDEGATLLDLKIEIARRLEDPCMLCERRCRARRHHGGRGVCGVLDPRIASEFIHMGEEEELIPSHTIFFAGCNLSCIYCQNWDISREPESGIYLGAEDLAAKIGSRYESSKGRIRNVNWVGGDPIPNLRYILEVMHHIHPPIPQVWNSNLYMTLEALEVLFGVIDLYLPDFKYGNNRCGERLSKVKNYYGVLSRNIARAARHGDMIVRHLILPGHVECCTKKVIETLANIDEDRIKLNLMDQYHPDYHWDEDKGLGRRISAEEWNEALSYAKEMGLTLVSGQV